MSVTWIASEYGKEKMTVDSASPSTVIPVEVVAAPMKGFPKNKGFDMTVE